MMNQEEKDKQTKQGMQKYEFYLVQNKSINEEITVMVNEQQ